MLLEEKFEKALSLKEEPKSSLLMIDLVLLARSENISDKEIKATLRHLFVKYYEEGNNNNDESRDKADKIATDLAKRLQNRKLFEYVDYNEENLAQIQNMLKENGLDERYYLRIENIEASVYSPYKGRKILIEKLNGDIVALEKASTIVESITKGQTKKEGTIFFPK